MDVICPKFNLKEVLATEPTIATPAPNQKAYLQLIL